MNLLKYSSWLGLVILINVSCSSSSTIESNVALNLINDTNYFFLDVRTVGEHENKSIRGTKCIPLQEIEQRLDELEDKKRKKIIVYCRSGNRSKTATKILNNNGFYAYNLSGGINQWKGEIQSGSQSMVLLKGKTTMRNVLGTELVLCSKSPMTGFRRDGFCRTDDNDRGLHLVAAIMTKEFLDFTKSKGNDLSSPNPVYGFPGLVPGDKWCLCALRWKEAYDEGFAPPVVLEATNEKALEIIKLEQLLEKGAASRSQS